MVDAAGRLLATSLLAGQRPDLDAAPQLLAMLPASPGRVVADRGFSAARLRHAIAAIGARPCIPPNPTHPHVPWDRAAYARRHKIENFWSRMKEWRAIAMRYDKRAECYRAGLLLAASLDWIKE